MDFTIVIPFWNGNGSLQKLLDTIPLDIPVIVSKDYDSDEPEYKRDNTTIIRLDSRGYFAGACNVGINSCNTDVLVLNQDVWFENDKWLEFIADNKDQYATFGDGVFGHPAWPNGYVQGTFMYISREAWDNVGKFNWQLYPLWGCTCEWQLRACRKNYKVLPVSNVPGLVHKERNGSSFGDAITETIKKEPGKRQLFTHTPPIISIIVPCYNYGKYLDDCINSLLGGKTCLGEAKPQSLQSFEVIIVNDASTDDSIEVIKSLSDDWKAIKYVNLKKNLGTAGAINEGIKRANGYFIHILSADDMRSDYTLENFVNAALQNPKKFIYGDTTTFSSGKKVQLLKMGEYDFDKLLTKNNIPAGIVFPKQAWVEVGGYPSDFGDGREDWAFAVSLGEMGWCGHYIGELSGNLYRREKQNRSYINANTKKKGYNYYLGKMKSRFRHLYDGERSKMCCGNRKTSTPTKRTPPPVESKSAVVEQLEALPGVTVMYTGSNIGTETWYGRGTGNTYKFGLNTRRRLGKVAEEDLQGLLESGHFTVVKSKRKPPRIRPTIAKEPRAIEEPKPEIAEIMPDSGVDDEGIDFVIESYDTDNEENFDNEIDIEVNATDGALQYANELNIEAIDLVDYFGEEHRITKYDVENYARNNGLV